MSNAIFLSSGGGSGSVTSITAGTGLTATPNPIIATGTIGLNTTNITTLDGTIYWNGTTLATTATGTTGQVLTSSGAGSAPAFANATTVTSIAGTANQITASAATGAVTLSIPAAFTAPGSITAASGNITATAGNLVLPITTSTVGQIVQNGVSILHTFGVSNIFVGRGAGNFTTTTGNSTGVGAGCLASLTTGTTNTAIGDSSGAALTTGQTNTLIGASAGAALVTTQNNVFIGFQAGSTNKGTDNVMIGSLSGSAGASFTGTSNVFAGKSTGTNYTGAESSNILFGSQVLGTAGESNTLRIGAGTGTGTGQLNRAFISGIFGITVGGTGIPVLVDTNNQLGTVASSKRYKENIFDMSSISDVIYKLRPVVFNYKKDENKSMCYGLIAEEVEEIIPNIVVKNKDNEPETVKYLDLIPMLLNEVKKIRSEINQLKNL